MRAMRAVIGLELHARLRTVTKAFSPAVVSFARQPNTAAAAFDAAHPGTYPVVNRSAVDAAIRTGLALNMQVADRLQFDRKHYFYYDLPAGYQITQERHPICRGGRLDIGQSLRVAATTPAQDTLEEEDGGSGRGGGGGSQAAGVATSRYVRIARLQLEHDSAKSVHTAADDTTLVDLNRAGIGLMEIVTEPDLTSSAEAVAFVRELLGILKALDVCDGSLSEGSLRVDANVNIVDDRGIVTPRCEVKNINGLRFLAKAIEYEISRQTRAVHTGEALRQETRYFDPQTGETIHMRVKEENLDYRYMPEPDLPPMAIPQAWVDACRERLPVLPGQRIAMTASDYGLSEDHARLLVTTTGALDLFESCMRQLKDMALATQAATFITTDIFAHAKQRNEDVGTAIDGTLLAELLSLVHADTISLRAAKEILGRMLDGDRRSPTELMEALDLRQESDAAVLQALVVDVVANNPKQRNKFLKGQTGVLGFFVGQVMGKTKGKANPQKVKQAVEQELAKFSHQASC